MKCEEIADIPEQTPTLSHGGPDPTENREILPRKIVTCSQTGTPGPIVLEGEM